MNHNDAFREYLSLLNPNIVLAYLDSKEWTIEKRIINKYCILTKKDNRIILPLNKTFSDFNLRMLELINCLSLDESRTKISIINDLTSNFGFDVIRISIFNNVDIPLFNTTIIDNIKNIILYTIYSTFEKKSIFPNPSQTPCKITDLLKVVLLGQTEIGSYVLPIKLEIENKLFGDQVEEPIQRKISKNIMKSLSLLSSCAASQSFLDINNKVEQGISANLCDYVYKALECIPNKDLIINVSWAQTIRMTDNVPNSVVFKDGMTAYIKEFSRKIKEMKPISDILIDGFVIELEKNPPIKNSEKFLATIWTKSIDAEYKNVKIELSREDYFRVIYPAHGADQIVECRGTLHISGKNYTLKDIVSIDIKRVI